MQQIPVVLRVEDYKLEELLRYPERFANNKAGLKRKNDVDWRQMVQYAASHSVNDFYGLPEAARSRASIEASVEQWWTNRNYKFHSDEHFLQMKQTLKEQLTSFLLGGSCPQTPIIFYEQLTAYVEELDLEISQIFHLVAVDPDGGADDYIVQKLAVDVDEESLSLLFHMTSVFCMSAFGKLPTRIEVLSLLNGKKVVYVPDEASLESSYDYMYLIKSLLPEADVFKVNPGSSFQFVM
ncbi:hypothetical protein FHS16_003443 [Paenibacillus endophyticus]|uniref:Uncharacterized protein n=1 Tax=Paenibacillus endophyticus TaxID=1294268 RepID=A0A7W5C932_9BACL|nr:hypothetical protein [Paenibacillus endophyticus]MBB3153381.1 hypothetical protein [Paenibacillus endophyticus]